MADGDLDIQCGEDWTATMTFKRADVATQVDDPEAQIRRGKDSGTDLVLDLTTYITQASPGVMTFLVPEDITKTLPAGQFYWDFFGTVAGKRMRLVPLRQVIISPAVTEAP